MTIQDDFLARFNEFDIDDVTNYSFVFEDAVWGAYYGNAYAPKTKEIILNLIAHLLTLEALPTSSAVRTETSKSVGSVSTSYAESSNKNSVNDFFDMTKYGQRFVFLTASRATRGFFV